MWSHKIFILICKLFYNYTFNILKASCNKHIKVVHFHHHILFKNLLYSIIVTDSENTKVNKIEFLPNEYNQ